MAPARTAVLFQTPEFALLFIGTAVTFYVLPRRARLSVLAVGSLLFYAASSVFDFALLVFVLFLTYRLTCAIEIGGRRIQLYAVIVIMIGLLAYFKYANFVSTNIDRSLTFVGWDTFPHVSSMILPLGISFYTFQIVAYAVDLRLGRSPKAPTFLHYLVFVLFFGQLIAGPIMRGQQYLHQLNNLRGATTYQMVSGGQLIIIGLVKKVVLADAIGHRVDRLFISPESMTQPEAWVAAYLFAFQIYFDFSGYVDIALGLGRILGLHLQPNFRTPYLSRNPGEFWARWHITLSSWFRDYVYIPTGGNRLGRPREMANLMFVMAVAGLWHGAGWTFVLWGLLHGTYLVAHRLIERWVGRFRPFPSPALQSLSTVATIWLFFHLTVIAWVPFRAESLSDALHVWSSMLQFGDLPLWSSFLPHLTIIIGLYGLHILERLAYERGIAVARMWRLSHPALRGVTYAGLVLLVLLQTTTEQAFIYFRF